MMIGRLIQGLSCLWVLQAIFYAERRALTLVERERS